MIKFIALNILTALFVTSCSHSNQAGHHHHEKANKPCKVGQACDDSKKESCCDKKEKAEDCCKS